MAKKIFFPLLLTIVVSLLCAGLGIWQLKRLQWKESLIVKLSNVEKAPLIEVSSFFYVSKKEIKDLEFQKVILRGHFLNQHRFLILPRYYDGKMGAHIFSPFVTQSMIVWVNRGWVKTNDRGKLETKIENLSGDIKIHALTRLNDERKNNLSHDFLYANLKELNAKSQIDANDQIYFDRVGDESFFVKSVAGKQVLANRHLEYALTWFSFAILMIIIFLVYLRRIL